MRLANLIKSAAILSSVILISGCGGGSDISKIDLKKAVSNKTFYADNTCEDPSYFSEKYTDSEFILKSFSDDNFTNEVETKTYSIKEFTDDDLILLKDGIEYTCGIDYEYATDTNKITEISINCDSDNVNADIMPFLVAYPTKELAIKNKNTQCN